MSNRRATPVFSPSVPALGHALGRAAAAFLAALLIAPVGAAPREDSAQIKTVIETFLRGQTASLPGQVSVIVGQVEASPSRPPCANLEAAMAPGARPMGRTTVLVRCRSEGGWSLYVPVQIKVVTEYLATARSLSQGQLIGETDIVRQSGDLGDLPNGVITDPSAAVGRVAAMPIPAGRPLLVDLLRQPPVIQAGQTVKVISRGATFEVSNEGRALAAAADGKVVQVRLNSGQVVSGIARPGSVVEIAF